MRLLHKVAFFPAKPFRFFWGGEFKNLNMGLAPFPGGQVFCTPSRVHGCTRLGLSNLDCDNLENMMIRSQLLLPLVGCSAGPMVRRNNKLNVFFHLFYREIQSL